MREGYLEVREGHWEADTHSLLSSRLVSPCVLWRQIHRILKPEGRAFFSTANLLTPGET